MNQVQRIPSNTLTSNIFAKTLMAELTTIGLNDIFFTMKIMVM